MSGHSHWAGIKHKKEAADQKRGQVFSKLLAAISAAAKTEPNPEFNPRLRTAIEKAKGSKMPAENIERAVKRASEAGQNIEELVFEAYGPGGAAIIVEAISDNKNRTVQEIKKILNEFGGKWAESGGVRWAFEKNKDGGWVAKFPQELGADDKSKLETLVAELENQDDTQKIFTNAK
jgi:YebC/PmpR family DNA-binding regulatory protein